MAPLGESGTSGVQLKGPSEVASPSAEQTRRCHGLTLRLPWHPFACWSPPWTHGHHVLLHPRWGAEHPTELN